VLEAPVLGAQVAAAGKGWVEGVVGKPTATDLLYRTHGTLKVGRMKRVGAAERATA
jgi:hypothetical protein